MTTLPPPPALLSLEVSAVRSEARDVLFLELRDPAGGALPPFAPGAHLELQLPGIGPRHYSLCNDAGERDRYCIAVGRSPTSRGGSRFVHEAVRRGDVLSSSAPRNHFPLVEDAPAYCFVAGGIGITPLLSMIRRCRVRGAPWALHYCVRSRQRAAFYEELCALAAETGGALHLHADDEQAGRLFDPAAALRGLAPEAHVYCCGPAPLMQAVQAATHARAAERVHFEWFAAPASAAPAAGSDQPFTVTIRSTGQSIAVPVGQTLLDALDAHGVAVPSSCREGTCGTCQTRVLSGLPDHRDAVLSAAQREANETMLVCVSRARSERLELDL